MKSRITIVLCLLLAAFFVNAAPYVHRVIIVNEGHYDYANSVQTVPVTLGVYNPATAVYTSIDTITNARFATHVIVDGQNIYVAADSMVIRYDANTYERKATAIVEGVRKMAVWNNQLIVSRGEYGKSFSAYVQVFDKSTLGFLYELDSTVGPKYATESIIVKNDIAYVAIGNGFDYGNEVGLIGKVDLVNQSYLNEINLGSTGRNPEGMFIQGDSIYTVNNNSYDMASISKVDVVTSGVNTTSLQVTTGCGASDFYGGYVYYQVSGDNKIGKFDPTTMSTVAFLQINQAVYGIGSDPVNNLLYMGETDYTSTGKINIYDLTGNFQSSFNVSVAPGNIAFDIRNNSGIAGLENNTSFYAYPNPAQDQITVVSTKDSQLFLYDVTGREVMSSNVSGSTSMNISSLSAGVYYLRSDNAEQIKIVKQ